MKRENYNIEINGKLVAIKHAWNTAKRETPVLVKFDILEHQDETQAEMISSSYIKSERKEYFMGVEIWRTSTGREIIVQIKKVK